VGSGDHADGLCAIAAENQNKRAAFRGDFNVRF